MRNDHDAAVVAQSEETFSETVVSYDLPYVARVANDRKVMIEGSCLFTNSC